MGFSVRATVGVVVAGVAIACSGAPAPTAPEAGAPGGAFTGETVSLIVPYSVGGGYDLYARMIAPYLEDELEGATVTVSNEPGGGGLLAINQLLAADSDGTRLALMNGVGTAGAVLAGAEGVAFALDDLAFVGRVAAEDHVWVTSVAGPWHSLEQVLAGQGFRFGSTGPGGGDYVVPTLMMAILDLEGEIVTGFSGSAENELAVTRGDVDGMTGDVESRRGAIEDGDHRALLVIGDGRHELLPDVRSIRELDLPAGSSELVEPTLDLLAMGRPLVVSASTPPERLEALRSAFERAMIRTGLEQEARSTGRPLTPLPGAVMADIAARLADPPERFRETLADAY